jgi:hypothetical protein
MSGTPVDDLRAELAAGQAVVVVGSGVSVAATGNASAASWTGLLENGVAYCQSLLGPTLPQGWAERRRGQLASGDTEELISAAEDITRRLGGPGGGEYLNWLEQSVGQLIVTRPELLEALAGLGVPLATTNYDGLLEQATDLPAVTWRDGVRVEQVLRGRRSRVLLGACITAGLAGRSITIVGRRRWRVGWRCCRSRADAGARGGRELHGRPDRDDDVDQADTGDDQPDAEQLGGDEQSTATLRSPLATGLEPLVAAGGRLRGGRLRCRLWHRAAPVSASVVRYMYCNP